MGLWKSLMKPPGQLAAERRGEAYYKPIVFGVPGSGLVELTTDGRVKFHHRDQSATIRVEDVTAVEVEDGSDLVQRTSVARAGGGAVAGGLLLGPIGMLAGLGLGATAKKPSGGEKFLVIESPDATIFAKVPAKHVTKAHELRQAILRHS